MILSWMAFLDDSDTFMFSKLSYLCLKGWKSFISNLIIPYLSAMVSNLCKRLTVTIFCHVPWYICKEDSFQLWIVKAQHCCLNCSPSPAKAFHSESVNYFFLVKLASNTSIAVAITIIYGLLIIWPCDNSILLWPSYFNYH